MNIVVDALLQTYIKSDHKQFLQLILEAKFLYVYEILIILALKIIPLIMFIKIGVCAKKIDF